MPPDLAIGSKVVRIESIVLKFSQGNDSDVVFQEPFQYGVVLFQGVQDPCLCRAGALYPFVVIAILAFGATELPVSPAIKDVMSAFQAHDLLLIVYNSIFHKTMSFAISANIPTQDRKANLKKQVFPFLGITICFYSHP